MRLRIALPILLASASVMLAGLSIGHAQDPQPGQPGQQAGPVRATPRAQGKRPARPRPGRPAPAAAEAPATPSKMRPFETGIDYEPTSPRARVTFNLEDADLPDLVRLISNITGKRFILPGKMRSIKASVFAPTKVRVSEAYNAFLSILEVNGMTVIPSGRYLKIVDTQGIEQEPTSINQGNRGTPNNDGFQTRLHPLQNVSAEDAANLLSRFKSTEGSVTAYAPTNTLIITDTGAQIRRMLRLLESVDVQRTGERIWIERIHYRDAAELATQIQELFPVSVGGSAGGGRAAASSPRPTPPRASRRNPAAAQAAARPAGPTTVGSAPAPRTTRLIPDERSNSLIIVATEPTYLRVMELIQILDQPLDGDGSGTIHVYRVQYGDATDLASTLSGLVGGGGGAGAPGAAALHRPGQPGANPSAALAAAGAARGGGGTNLTAIGGFEGEVGITAHETTNSLVVTASVHDYVAIRSVLERLDAPPRQVFIEAVIMELSVSRSNDLGLSFHGGAGDFPTTGSLSIFGFNAGTSLNPFSEDLLTGLALGVRGPTIDNSEELIGVSVPGFGVVLHALAQSGDANVLSTPHIMAMDNVQAEITVGQNVPLQTSGLGGLAGGLGGLSGLAGLAGGQQGGAGGLAGLAGLAGGLGGGMGVPRQDVGTTIRITPHINESDEVRMEIEEEISERGATEGTLGVVSINRRSAKTEVLVRDQQTVVIGGLMRDSVTTSQTKVPILGDIPLLGALFRRTNQQKQKTNLLLFLTPYIIRDPADLRSIFERKMRERQEFLDRYFVFGDHEYEPPVDYSRTRGLVLEILNEIHELDAEHELLQQVQGEPPPTHAPGRPVGSAPEEPPEMGEGDVVISPESSGPSGEGEGEDFESAEVEIEANIESEAGLSPGVGPE
ncbi:MAG: type II secretion system secretin GspD [Myxococcales bacterium]|nr:type II secretion system secretin GspD [Myxococcales bacterium]